MSSKLGFGYKASKILLIYSITPLHPGVGRVEGIVDNPVQRDALGFPEIYSTSLKGALKSRLWLSNRSDAQKYFGKEGEDTRPGLLSVESAKLLVLPARSLVGVCVGVTSPFLIKRFKVYLDILRDAELIPNNYSLLDVINELNEPLGDLKKDMCIITRKDNYLIDGKIVFNEEYVLTPKDMGDAVIKFWNEIKDKGLPFEDIAIVHNDVFNEIMDRSLIRQTRIRLERETKTVVRGGLWTEELIPEGSIFFTIAFAKPDSKETASKDLDNALGGLVFIGGDESTGKGLIKIVIK
jgi:CRISPR-associated protein Cmr4